MPTIKEKWPKSGRKKERNRERARVFEDNRPRLYTEAEKKRERAEMVKGFKLEKDQALTKMNNKKREYAERGERGYDDIFLNQYHSDLREIQGRQDKAREELELMFSKGTKGKQSGTGFRSFLNKACDHAENGYQTEAWHSLKLAEQSGASPDTLAKVQAYIISHLNS